MIYRKLIITICLICIPVSGFTVELSAADIMEKNFFAAKLKKVVKNVKMTLINARNEKRERKIVATMALQENGIDSNMLVRFIEPADIKGTGFLQHEHFQSDDDLWIYLPALHKSRRLISSNKKDSFIGSDFSYGDMLPPKVSLYRHKLVAEETINGKQCYIIESTPKNTTVRQDYGYGSKKSWIDKLSFHEVRVQYFDTENRLLKTQTVSDIRLVDKENSRWNALRREMVNHQTKHKTIVQAEDYTTDVQITKHTFTVRSLEWF